MEFLLLFYSLGLLGLYFLLLPYFKTHMHTLTNKNIKKSSWHSFLLLLFIYYLQNEKVKFLGFFIFVVLDAVIFSIWWVVFWNQRRWVWGWENCKPFHYCLLVSVVQPAVVLCCAVPLSGNFFFQNALLSACVWYFHFGPHKQFLLSIFIYFKEKLKHHLIFVF